MIPKTIIHLLSGGLDSVTMLYDLKQQGHAIHCLLFDNKDVRDNWFAAGIVFAILSVCWPITLGFLLGSLAQRWLK